ncbi:MAG: hypothetical protein JWR85_1636 [Marmoricola sp.]|nr:hypothetical protein [Marmoricola sp.]
MPDDWVSVHVYHQGDLDALLADVLGPALGSASGTPCFFVRHWDGGPHVRIRLRLGTGLDGGFAASACALVERCRRYLASHRSEDRLSEDAYLERARVLGRREGIGQPSPLAPNDSVRHVPYRFDAARYGVTARCAVERHFVESSRLAMALLLAGTGTAQRVSVAFAATVLLSIAVGGQQAGRQDRWRYWAGPEPQLAESYAEVYESQRGDLQTKVARLRHVADADSENPATADVFWWRSIAALRAALPEREGPVRRADVLDTCTHLLCNRLGLTPPLEGLARYLAERATAHGERRNGE